MVTGIRVCPIYIAWKNPNMRKISWYAHIWHKISIFQLAVKRTLCVISNLFHFFFSSSEIAHVSMGAIRILVHALFESLLLYYKKFLPFVRKTTFANFRPKLLKIDRKGKLNFIFAFSWGLWIFFNLIGKYVPCVSKCFT